MSTKGYLAVPAILLAAFLTGGCRTCSCSEPAVDSPVPASAVAASAAAEEPIAENYRLTLMLSKDDGAGLYTCTAADGRYFFWTRANGNAIDFFGVLSSLNPDQVVLNYVFEVREHTPGQSEYPDFGIEGGVTLDCGTPMILGQCPGLTITITVQRVKD